MTIRSTLFGGAGIPLGGAILAADAADATLIEVDNREYLLAGATVPHAAKYTPFLANMPGYSETAADLRTGFSGLPMGSVTSYYCEAFHYNGARYVGATIGSSGLYIRHSTDMVTWTLQSYTETVFQAQGTHAISVGTSLYMATTANAASGARVLRLTPSGDSIAVAGAASGIDGSNGIGALASKPDGSVMVAVDTNGAVYTAADGPSVAWTARGAAPGGSNRYGCIWSQSANAFLFFGTSSASQARVWRCENGYTSSADFGFAVDTFYDYKEVMLWAAASPTSAIFSAGGGRICRTTDGATGAEIVVSPTADAGHMALSYDAVNGVYWACRPNVTVAGEAQKNLFFSTDDGLTWKRATYYYADGVPDSFTASRPPRSAGTVVAWFGREPAQLRAPLVLRAGPTAAPTEVGRSTAADAGSKFVRIY